MRKFARSIMKKVVDSYVKYKHIRKYYGTIIK